LYLTPGLCPFGCKAEARLAPSHQFQIELGQQLGVEQGAMEFTSRIVDTESAAERIK
jgi:hypothetical protein